ncbi:MAG TPA: hypothetical protein VMG99_01295 [Thermoplasmata archaeon]|nr:hypothetical protein [Thermoplasmata archaeon]
MSDAEGALALGAGVGIGALIAYLLFPWKPEPVVCPYGDELPVDGTCPDGYTVDPDYPGCCVAVMCPTGDVLETDGECPTCYEPDPAHAGCCMPSPCSEECPDGTCGSPYSSCCCAPGYGCTCCSTGTSECCNQGGPIGCNPCTGPG